MIPGWLSRRLLMSSGVNRSWTSQWPLQAMISTLVCAAVLRARYSSGSIMTRGTPSASMIFLALPEVQQTSDSAFTAADVRDRVEDVRGLVVVRQDDGIALPLEPQDGGDVIGQDRPFEGRDVPL